MIALRNARRYYLTLIDGIVWGSRYHASSDEAIAFAGAAAQQHRVKQIAGVNPHTGEVVAIDMPVVVVLEDCGDGSAEPREIARWVVGVRVPVRSRERG
jgi:hypothetical protein